MKTKKYSLCRFLTLDLYPSRTSPRTKNSAGLVCIDVAVDATFSGLLSEILDTASLISSSSELVTGDRSSWQYHTILVRRSNVDPVACVCLWGRQEFHCSPYYVPLFGLAHIHNSGH